MQSYAKPASTYLSVSDRPGPYLSTPPTLILLRSAARGIVSVSVTGLHGDVHQ